MPPNQVEMAEIRQVPHIFVRGCSSERDLPEASDAEVSVPAFADHDPADEPQTAIPVARSQQSHTTNGEDVDDGRSGESLLPVATTPHAEASDSLDDDNLNIPGSYPPSPILPSDDMQGDNRFPGPVSAHVGEQQDTRESPLTTTTWAMLGQSMRHWSENTFGGGRRNEPWHRPRIRHSDSHPTMPQPRHVDVESGRQPEMFESIEVNNPGEISFEEFRMMRREDRPRSAPPSLRSSWLSPGSEGYGASTSPESEPSTDSDEDIYRAAGPPFGGVRRAPESDEESLAQAEVSATLRACGVRNTIVRSVDRVRPLPRLEIPASPIVRPSSENSGMEANGRAGRVMLEATKRLVGPLSYRRSPWQLMHRDLVFFLQHFWAIPKLFGGADGPSTPIIVSIGHLVMVSVSIGLTLLCIVVLLSGLVFVILLLYLFALLSHRFQGPCIRESKALRTLVYENRPKAEKWFFVNGIATTGSGAQDAIDHLHAETGRPVTAIHNRSLGAWFDLVECILMRDLHFNTANIRNGYKHIFHAVADPEIEKIVIIAHSQGGIIATAWVDQLITDFSREMLQRLEVYTFASAADHFSRARPTPGRVNQGRDGLFGRVEHFANKDDFVAKYGVLNPDIGAQQTEEIRYGRFTGRIFSRERSGHSLLGHYLCSANPQNSILRIPGMRNASRLAAYLDGGFRLHGKSYMVNEKGEVSSEKRKVIPGTEQNGGPRPRSTPPERTSLSVPHVVNPRGTRSNPSGSNGSGGSTSSNGPRCGEPSGSQGPSGSSRPDGNGKLSANTSPTEVSLFAELTALAERDKERRRNARNDDDIKCSQSSSTVL